MNAFVSVGKTVLSTTLSLLLLFNTHAQNVGIGTNTPATRLDVAGANAWDLVNTEGDMRIGNASYRLKVGVALGGGGAGAVGIMQAGGVGIMNIGAGGTYLLALNGANSTSSFTGNVGIGTNPATRLDVAGANASDLVNGEGDVRIGSPAYRLKIGVALTGPTAGATAIMQMGGTPVLSIGAGGNYLMQMNGSSSVINFIGKVGIGNGSPNAPLSFPAVLGKKITLYPGASGDVGLGVAGNRLQIFSDNPNADVAIGYDAAGTFNERFAVKPNGALALMGNTGSSKQIITSNGSGNQAQWSSFLDMMPIISTEGNVSISTNTTESAYSGANISLNITQNSKVLVFATVKATKTCIIGPCTNSTALYFKLNGSNVANSTQTFPAITWPGYDYDTRSYGPLVFDFTPGNYTLVPWQFLSVGAPMSFNIKTTTLIIPK